MQSRVEIQRARRAAQQQASAAQQQASAAQQQPAQASTPPEMRQPASTQPQAAADTLTSTQLLAITHPQPQARAPYFAPIHLQPLIGCAALNKVSSEALSKPQPAPSNPKTAINWAATPALVNRLRAQVRAAGGNMTRVSSLAAVAATVAAATLFPAVAAPLPAAEQLTPTYLTIEGSFESQEITPAEASLAAGIAPFAPLIDNYDDDKLEVDPEELEAFLEAHAELLDIERPIVASRSAARTDIAEMLYEEVESGAIDIFIDAAEALSQAELYLMNEARTTPEVAEEIRDAAEQVRHAVQLATDADEYERDYYYELIAWRTERLLAALMEAQPSVTVAVPRELTPDESLAVLFAEARDDAPRLAQTYENLHARYSNGRLPAHALQSLSWAPNQRLRPDAATQLERLNEAYRIVFGTDLAIVDSYRTFARQAATRARGRGAVPGTSEHGWGLAVDLSGGVNRFRTPQHNWLRENAHHFGWILPTWARERGSKPEPWHWEFVGDLAAEQRG